MLDAQITYMTVVIGPLLATPRDCAPVQPGLSFTSVMASEPFDSTDCTLRAVHVGHTKNTVALLSLIGLFMMGCAGSVRPTPSINETPKGQDCVRNCQFRKALCASSCDRKWGTKAPANYDRSWLQRDLDQCMDECRRRLQNCLKECLPQNPAVSEQGDS